MALRKPEVPCIDLEPGWRRNVGLICCCCLGHSSSFPGLSEIVAHILVCHLNHSELLGFGGRLGSKAGLERSRDHPPPSLTGVSVPGPASPGPSLEVPDELLLLSPLAHPELVGNDVAGMDPALGTGPAEGGRIVTSPHFSEGFPSLPVGSPCH